MRGTVRTIGRGSLCRLIGRRRPEETEATRRRFRVGGRPRSTFGRAFGGRDGSDGLQASTVLVTTPNQEAARTGPMPRSPVGSARCEATEVATSSLCARSQGLWRGLTSPAPITVSAGASPVRYAFMARGVIDGPTGGPFAPSPVVTSEVDGRSSRTSLRFGRTGVRTRDKAPTTRGHPGRLTLLRGGRPPPSTSRRVWACRLTCPPSLGPDAAPAFSRWGPGAWARGRTPPSMATGVPSSPRLAV